ncbi:MAG: hypothetical protein V4792_02455 [Pseudomonadota bacterium]
MPLTPLQLGVGSALLIAAAALVYSWIGDDDGERSGAAATASNAALSGPGGAGKGGSTVESGTSVLMANPFSTFQQTPARDPAAAAASGAPPASPFSYVGKRIEGGRQVVVLLHQGRYVAVHGPGMLDAQYEVERIDGQQIVLLYHPLMTRQVLTLSAPPPQTLFHLAPPPASPPPQANETEVQEGN